jgi:tRNA A37 threonylcarbamoyladenosine dehydratase
MSNLVFRGLNTSTTVKVSTLPSSLRNINQNNFDKEQGAVTLSKLDYLLKSDDTKKGSMPISLLSPNELKTKNSNKVTKAQLLQGLDNITPFTNNNNSINSTTRNTSTFVPTSYNFIDTDYTSEKLELAIEAIDNWERKVKSLDLLISNANGQKGIAYKESIKSSSDKLNKARQEAINARQNAIVAYNNALKEMMEIGNTSSSKASVYRQKYSLMESKFESVKERDKKTMEKVKEYLNSAFNYIIDYANPFSY